MGVGCCGGAGVEEGGRDGGWRVEGENGDFGAALLVQSTRNDPVTNDLVVNLPVGGLGILTDDSLLHSPIRMPDDLHSLRHLRRPHSHLTSRDS